MKRPLAYITAAWSGDEYEDTDLAARYCRAVYEAGFSPVCPTMYIPLFLNDAIPEEHKSAIDMGRDLLRRSHVLVVCGGYVGEVEKQLDGAVKELAAMREQLEDMKQGPHEKDHAKRRHYHAGSGAHPAGAAGGAKG